MSSSPLSSLITSLKSQEIIPEVIPESFVPSVLFSIVYMTSGKEAILGSELTREDTLDEPDINFTPLIVPDASSGADGEEQSYTLVMTDPDAPSRADPKFREFRHWVITGLKAPATTSATTANLNAVKTKAATTPYRPPGPPPGSGYHRYTFLLFQEPTTSDFTIPEGATEYGAALEERRSWSAAKFGEKYGLKLVGASFFLVKSVD